MQLSDPKPHYIILDGLRGVAAILVVIFHIFELSPQAQLVHHGYLAVDFFFLLSGFVIAYAYDDRWKTMGIFQFFKRRLIRLHPMVIFGVLLGAIAFWFNPLADGTHSGFTWFQFLGVVLIGLSLLPTPDVHTYNETHSLNGPMWSLLQEYFANVLYALVLRKVSVRVLKVLVAISGIALIATTLHFGDISRGWDYKEFWAGSVRVLFSFMAGVLLFRLKQVIRIPYSFLLCSIAIVSLLCLPNFNKANGIYEALTIVLIFPLLLSVAAGGVIHSQRIINLSKFFGRISYPLYLIHYPFMYIYFSWLDLNKPSLARTYLNAGALFLFFFSLAFLVLKFYDEPVRKWLAAKK